MIEREHGVRLAATEVGLELHHRKEFHRLTDTFVVGDRHLLRAYRVSGSGSGIGR